ncbi:MAG: DUF1624 domain-containing protein [Gemmatimonadetes bacterium]|nr:DUF1624 domain-containing protein [Gemmatimonadota bacterium]
MATEATPVRTRPEARPVGAGSRVASIDIVRGVVMVLMAIDHVRVYSGLPAGGPTPGIFFTRWVTHFCAPAFVFLAGTSAFLSGARRTPAELSRYLLIRGAWLVLLELTVIRFAWTFNFDYAHYLLAGVIWVIGWCMILMAGLVRLPVGAIGAIGLVIIAGHNVMDFVGPKIAPAVQGSSWAWVLQVLYFGGGIQLGAGGPWLGVLYSIIPWIGVMAAGYAFGAILVKPAPERRRICLGIGVGATVLFLALRGFNLYGNPTPWRPPSMLSFLATNKYPASLSFLLMTLGPSVAVLPALEHVRGWLARVLEVFGRVPFFYYLLHIPLIHLLAMVVSWIRLGHVSPWLFTNHPLAPGEQPEGYMWGLGLLYLVWLGALVLLYFPCRRYDRLKRERRAGWMAYL